MLAVILVVAVGTAAKWLTYTALLWIMIKIQRLNYNVLGLLGSSLLATLVNLIPWVGPYLSYAVLVICLWKCTGADIAPDVMFTVTIAQALMFCVNLWVFAALIGNLRHVVIAQEPPTVLTEQGETPEEPETEEARPPVAPPIKYQKIDPKICTLKGVSITPAKRLAMVGAGGRIYTLAVGDNFTIDGEQGPQRVRCEEINRGYIILALPEGEKIKLPVR